MVYLHYWKRNNGRRDLRRSLSLTWRDCNFSVYLS